MNKYRLYRKEILVVVIGLLFMISSCVYNEIVDADYLDQTIYMPAATYGVIYDVSDVSDVPPDHPTSGKPYRYQIVESSIELIVPLGVYRAGVDTKGGFMVEITVDADTLATLIADGAFDDFSGTSDVHNLPLGTYSLPGNVSLSSGDDVGMFDLVIDLGFLRENSDEAFALGVSISSTEREVNPDLSTTVVFIPAGISDPLGEE